MHFVLSCGVFHLGLWGTVDVHQYAAMPIRAPLVATPMLQLLVKAAVRGGVAGIMAIAAAGAAVAALYSRQQWCWCVLRQVLSVMVVSPLSGWACSPASPQRSVDVPSGGFPCPDPCLTPATQGCCVLA
jgi:hypothetical protein